MKYPWIRVFISLLLILVLVTNISPIKAEAMALPEAGAAATASKIISLTAPLGTQIFGWVLLGLGLTISTINMINLVNEFQAFSDTLEVSVYYYPDGSWSYGVDMGFVDRVRAWLWDSGFLLSTNGFSFATSHTYTLMGSTYTFSSANPFDVIGLWHPSGNRQASIQFFVFGQDSKYVGVNGSSKTCKDYGFYYAGSFYEVSGSAVNDSSYVTADCPIMQVPDLTEDTIATIFGNEFPPEITTTVDGAELGEVAPQEVPLPDGYPEWYANSRPAVLPDSDEKIQVLPIPLNPDSESEGLPDGVTQPDAWAGSNADPLPDMDTDPDAGTNTNGAQSIIDHFTPSGTITDYSLDLSSLFPFCIPFDLYDFLSVLKADPVAPVFEFDLNLGVASAPICIDLSGWSDLASVVRALEVALFCIGLALKTKELIGT